MWGMDAWDGALLAAAAYLGITALVRLMRSRRDQLIAELDRRVEAERQRLKAEQPPDGARPREPSAKVGSD